MKVAFACYDGPDEVGGVSSWLRRLLPRLQAAGFAVEAHVTAAGGQPGVNCARFAADGVPFQWVPWMTDMPGAVRAHLRLLAQSQPDVYVPNCVLPAFYAAGYARQQGIPTVGVMHSDDAFYWGMVDEFVNGLERFRLSALVAVSAFMEEAVRPLAVNRLALHRIGCGVPVPGQTAAAPGDVFRLVYIGRLVEEQKRASEVARALCAAVAHVPGVEAWIVGEGPARSDVERIVRESPPADPERVRLLGRVDNHQIYSVLQECHALVLLSDYEGLPVSVMEAMAAGVVPICLEVRSGVHELVQSGVNGLLVRDRGADFVAGVRRLRDNPEQWRRLSVAARQTIAETYSLEACAARWADVLHSLRPSRAPQLPFRPPRWLRLPPPNPKFGPLLEPRLQVMELSWPRRWRFRLGKVRRTLYARLVKGGRRLARPTVG